VRVAGLKVGRGSSNAVATSWASSRVAFRAHDLMISVLSAIPYCTPAAISCTFASPYCAWGPQEEFQSIHPADLAEVKAQLSGALDANRTVALPGSGLAFTTRDLMTSVLSGSDACQTGGYTCGQTPCVNVSCDVSCNVTPDPCDETGADHG